MDLLRNCVFGTKSGVGAVLNGLDGIHNQLYGNKWRNTRSYGSVKMDATTFCFTLKANLGVSLLPPRTHT